MRGPWCEQTAGGGSGWPGGGQETAGKCPRGKEAAEEEALVGDPVIIKRNHLLWAGY